MTASKKLVLLAAVLVSLILVQSLRTQPPRGREEGDDQPPRRLEEGEDRPPDLVKFKLVEVNKEDDELHRLLKERYNAAVKEMHALYHRYTEEKGGPTLDDVFRAGRRVLKAGLELNEKPQEQVAFLRQYVEMTKEFERLKKALHDDGGISGDELHRAHYYRLDAEIRLLRLKKKAK